MRHKLSESREEKRGKDLVYEHKYIEYMFKSKFSTTQIVRVVA